jgi:4-amino-4-deoxy-L-arabinose transferase-like glycosyltransferase
MYPIILAAAIKLFGQHALAAVRWFQFLEGVAAAFFCAATAGMMLGKLAKKATLLIALFFPTLMIMPSILLTESTAIVLVAIFFYLLLRYLGKPSWALLVGLAIVVGLTALVRFNGAFLGLVVLGALFFGKSGLPKWRSAAVTILVSAIVVAPWLVRNWIVFDGNVLFSTQTGFDAAAGILIPQGRNLPGDMEKLKAAIGWELPWRLETNDPSRRELPDEPALNRICSRVALRAWREAGWRVVPITLEKLSYFWLSTDQLFSTKDFKPKVRLERAASVVIYWGLLALAAWGWTLLRRSNPGLAYLLLFYVSIVTMLHMPFNMNTRYRVPLIDPLIAVLAGLGCAAIAEAQVWGPRKIAPAHSASDT